MISKPEAKVTKGMIFAGCSFTWGQGLYYYSNLPSLREPEPDRYDPNMVQGTHLRYAEMIRFPRLVSQHFKQFDLVHPHNGGSNEGAVQWWRQCFNYTPRNKFEHYPIYRIEKSDISHVFFQFTQWQRDNYHFKINGQEYNLPFHAALNDENKKPFLDYLESQQLSLEQWIQMYIREGFTNVKNFLQECEQAGIKTYVYTWPDTYIDYIRNDPWMSTRFITFEYNSVDYACIEELMGVGTMQRKVYNPELTIKWDEEEFKVTPKDHHPSPKCHKVIAENIIKRLENDERSSINSL